MTDFVAATEAAAFDDDAPRRTPTRHRAGAPRVFSSVRAVLRHVVLIAVALLMLYPILWMIASSLRSPELIFSEPGLIPSTWDFTNYAKGWNALPRPFGWYLMNTSIVVLGSIVGNLLSCSLAAYAFARLEFLGSRQLFAILLLTLMIPVHVIIVPQYVMFSQIGWTDSFLPLVVPKFLATDAFFVFLMVQFIRGIPRALDEAARIDGAGHFRIFVSIILPLMVPALATTAIFTFIWTWNDFFGQLIYLTSPDNYTVPLALRGYLDSEGASSWGPMFAMSIIAVLPIFLVFLFGQRYLLRGIATTGLK